MPLTGYYAGIPLDFGQFIQSILNAMHSFALCLTAFLATGSVFRDAAITGVGAQSYLLGLGTADITGPVVETNMMGYANLPQTDTGLHMRQRARAFIIGDPTNSSTRVVFVNADIAMGDTGVRRSIVAQLSSLYPEYYNNANIAFVGTHQHSGVGGYLEDLLPQITSLGYVNQTAQAIITGTVLAVTRAHNSLAPGSLSLGNTTVLDANLNRSPSAYLQNPAAERALYEYDQDKELTLLRFDDAAGDARGFLSFFAVHGTSIYENNTLISSDNKGMAAYLYESSVEPTSFPGNATFVAGFTQANVGDTSPNTLGAFCESPGKSYDQQPCDFLHSTCGNATEDCHGRGPAFTESPYGFASNVVIAEKQFEGAKALMGGGGTAPLVSVNGSVRYVHTYMLMDNHTFTLPNGTSVQTCPPAMGYSFAGGTTDGPGAFDFTQGDNSSAQNPFWQIVKGALTPYPSAAQIACHAPKPILFNTGYAHTPYEWSPSTVDIQLLRVGQLVILVIPGELTTMSGRRIRAAVRAALVAGGVVGTDAYVVVAGPANTYAHYIATPEEYAAQRYEGASTIFGPWTLDAYIDRYSGLVGYLADNATTGASPTSDAPPAEQTSKAISLQTGVIVDTAPLGKKFGQVLVDANTTAYAPGEIVSATFVGANPRNNLRLEQTFLTVDQYASGAWTPVRSDSHPSTTYTWNRTSTILGTSTVTLAWTIESGTPSGTYRFTYHGDSKSIFGSISAFTGTSGNFTVSS